jgi:hypothetical protein
VPAVVKWVTDELDDPLKSLATKFKNFPLSGAVGAAHQKTVDVLRWLSPASLSKTVLLASPGTEDSADHWTQQQGHAIKHVLNTFSILDTAQYPAKFHDSGSHATIFRDEVGIEVVAVAGRSHEECDRHVMDAALTHRGPLLVVSRDEENTPWNPILGSYLDRGSETKGEVNITDTRSAVLRIGFQDFITAYREAANEAELREKIDAAIS